MGESKFKPLLVSDNAVAILASVETKNLFVNVTEKMERLDRNISSMQLTFQQRPKVLKPVSVDLSANVSLQVIHDLMHVLFLSQDAGQ
jgi:hypothetical protein